MANIEVLGVPHAYELTNSTSCPHALVFIHGWLLSRGYWQPVISRLSPAFQCLSYDLRGFGESQPITTQTSSTVKTKYSLMPRSLGAAASIIASPYTPAAYAQDLAVLLKELNITSAWLVGHSLGGTIALWAASQMPEIVKGVVCVNAGGGIYMKEAFEQFRTAGRQMLKLRPQWLKQMPLLDVAMTRANVARAIPRTWGKQRVVDFIVADREAALGALLDSTTAEEVNYLPQLVSQLQQPVHFIAGDQDDIMEPKYVNHLASFHPLFQMCGDNVLEIPNCGHLAMVEQPDVVAEHIESLVISH